MCIRDRSNGGQINLDGASIVLDSAQLITSGLNTGGSIQVGYTSPSLAGRSVPFPASVSIDNSSLVSDPPSVGGLISVKGGKIVVNALLNVFGLTGGRIELGSLETSSLSIGAASQFVLGPEGRVLKTLAPVLPSISIDASLPGSDGLKTLDPVAPSVFIDSSRSSSDTPLNTAQNQVFIQGLSSMLDGLSGDDFSIAVKLDESDFRLSNTVYKPASSDEEKPGDIQRDDSSASRGGSPGKRVSISGPKAIVNVLSLSSEEAAADFEQAEIRAARQTAQELGLSVGPSGALTAVQIQGLLQRVIRFLGEGSALYR